MPKVDFYVLKNGTNKLQFVCKLLEKAYTEQQKVYVHTDNQADAHTLDERLWTFKDNSFIPHNLSDENLKPEPPIQIGHANDNMGRQPILVNLSQTIPEAYARYQRIIEIVDEQNKAQAREHFKNYREKQCELSTYNV